MEKDMRWTWNWNDLLAFLLVLVTFGSVIAVIPLVHDDPALKRARATEDCQMLARAIKILPKLQRRKSSRQERGIDSGTLLYTWNQNVDRADRVGRWPRLSEEIRTWLHYSGSPATPPAGSQDVRAFLEGYLPDSLTEEERLMKAKRVGFDPWEKPYLINVGNMRNTIAPEPGIRLITWALSAGPNGIIETPDYLPLGIGEAGVSRDSDLTRGDDIGCVVGESPPPKYAWESTLLRNDSPGEILCMGTSLSDGHSGVVFLDHALCPIDDREQPLRRQLFDFLIGEPSVFMVLRSSDFRIDGEGDVRLGGLGKIVPGNLSATAIRGGFLEDGAPSECQVSDAGFFLDFPLGRLQGFFRRFNDSFWKIPVPVGSEEEVFPPTVLSDNHTSCREYHRKQLLPVFPNRCHWKTPSMTFFSDHRRRAWLPL